MRCAASWQGLIVIPTESPHGEPARFASLLYPPSASFPPLLVKRRAPKIANSLAPANFFPALRTSLPLLMIYFTHVRGEERALKISHKFNSRCAQWRVPFHCLITMCVCVGVCVCVCVQCKIPYTTGGMGNNLCGFP